jgi:tetratricopeptide (TPR) repeat protein
MKDGDTMMPPNRLFLMQRTAWSGVAIFLVTYVLFSPSLQYELVHIDDIAYIANNTFIHGGITGAGVRRAFSPDNDTATMYMPLLWVSYMLDIELLGAAPERPWGFHFTNVLLHALNAALVFILLFASCKNPWLAVFSAAVWAVHPLRVESVAWVSERKDVLSGFFGLLCIGTYLMAALRARSASRDSHGDALYSRPSRPLMLLSLALFTMGLLTKPSLVPLPFILLLLDVGPLNRVQLSLSSMLQAAPRLLIEKAPFFLLAALAAYGTVATHQIVSGEIPVPLSHRLQSVPLAYGFYVWKTLFPHNLTVLYPHWDAWLPSAHIVVLATVAGILLLGLTFVAWSNRARAPNQLVGWLWFLGMLLPVSGIIPIPSNDVADRFSYFPSIGLSIALLSVFSSQLRRREAVMRWLRPGLAILILSFLSLATARQLPVWKNTDTLFSHILSIFPSHGTALKAHADRLIGQTGDFRKAHELVSQALETDPYHWQALLTKAHCLAVLEGPESALHVLQRVPPPTSRTSHSNWQRDLARYKLMLGLYDDAAQHADRALSLLPDHDLSRVPVLLLAMTAAYEAGDMTLALAYARRFPPYAQKTTLELADLLPHAVFQWTAGYRRYAVDYFHRLVKAHPERLDYLNNLVWGLATAEWSPVDPDEVLDMAKGLVAMVPAPHPGIFDTLAAAQANAGDFEAAVQTMQEALALFPPSMDAELILFKERLAYRLALYEQKRPYREDAFIRLFVAIVGDLARISEPAPE